MMKLFIIFISFFCLPSSARTPDLMGPLKEISKQGVRVSAMFVIDGKEIASINPNEPLNPASVAKIFTASLGIERLGKDYKVGTVVSISSDEKKLYILGNGNPMVKSQDLEKLAKCVRDSAIHTVDSVIGVTSPFSEEEQPYGFGQRYSDRPFNAGIAGLQVNFSTIEVKVNPSKIGETPSVSILPKSDYVVVVNNAKTEKNKRSSLSITTEAIKNEKMLVKVSGTIGEKGGVTVYKRVFHPARFAIEVFSSYLKQVGVKINKGTEIVVLPPLDSKEICRHESTLVEMLPPLLKDSQNQIAETLLRLVGAQGADHPVGFKEGKEAMLQYLQTKVGLDIRNIRFMNGSGLYDANRLSSSDIVRMLEYIKKKETLDLLVSSLPVAGRDGTMRNRLRNTPLAGRVRAKTGTLEDVVSLAGYMFLPNGKTVVFGVITNQSSCKGDKDCNRVSAGEIKKAIDKCLLLVWARFSK